MLTFGAASLPRNSLVMTGLAFVAFRCTGEVILSSLTLLAGRGPAKMAGDCTGWALYARLLPRECLVLADYALCAAHTTFLVTVLTGRAIFTAGLPGFDLELTRFALFAQLLLGSLHPVLAWCAKRALGLPRT